MGCAALQRCDSIIACWMKSTMLHAATGLDEDDDESSFSVCALKLNEPDTRTAATIAPVKPTPQI